MTDDAKEWVTIKIPTDVRDDARDHDNTYGDIMKAGLEALYADMVAVRSGGEIELRTADDPIENTPTIEDVAGLRGRGSCEVDTDAIADAVAARGVSLDAGEHRAIAEEVVGMLR